MELHKAIKEIVASKGPEMINNIQIINFLLDFQAFKEKPATKMILRDLIYAGYGASILALQNTQDWQTKFKQYEHEFINTYGYKEELSFYVFDTIAYGIGLQESITQQVDNLKNKELEPISEEDLGDHLKNKYISYQTTCKQYKFNESYKHIYLTDRNGILYSIDKRALVSNGDFNQPYYVIRTGTQYIADSAWKLDTFDWKEYDLIIPETVVAIGSYSFEHTHFGHLIIPSSVKYIGEKAFQFSNFSHITFNNGLEYIGEGAFEYTNLTQFTIVETIKYIGYNAFPKNIDIINNSKYLSVKNGLIFNREENYLMSSCSTVEEPFFPDTLEVIGPFTFLGDKSIKKVTTGSSLKKICDGVFCACDNLREIVLSTNVKYIGEGVFEGCNNLCSIVSLSPHFEVVDDALYDKDEARLITYYGIDKIFKVKTGTKIIGKSAFYEIKSLQKVILPKSVCEIRDWAFWECDNLRELIVQNPDCIIEDEEFDMTLVKYDLSD